MIENEIQQKYRDEFDDLLKHWVDYMHRPDFERGYNGRASGGMLPCPPDKEQYYGAHDRDLFEAIDAAIRSLRVQERAALDAAYGLANVWRFEKLDQMQLLETARANLRLLLKKKHLLSAEYCATMASDGTLHVPTFHTDQDRAAKKPRGFSFSVAGFGKILNGCAGNTK